MKLRGVDFGSVWGQSGIQNFFGEGYPFHKFCKPFGLDFSGITFVAKTTTVAPRVGNMPLKKDGTTPAELKPKCIVVKPFAGVALNAVGLSGHGLKALLDTGKWQARREPFMISFMSVAATAGERLAETKEFVDVLKPRLSEFKANIAIQRNASCPNVGLEKISPDEFIDESWRHLGVLSMLGVPIVDKYSVTTEPETAVAISRHPCLSAVCVSNTVPWGKLPEKIDWQELFGTKESPLKKFGGGGLSGWPLLPLTADWVKAARDAGLEKPIAAGGGILNATAVDVLKEAGADAVCIGSVAMLRPWRVRGIIRHALEVYK
ncbi:MAG: hypothetical protein HY918_04570 [Candidatus Doudnabacteria bacterium]|nr:hypothetical protein [Candidatus Doudnabacteria bacterium]